MLLKNFLDESIYLYQSTCSIGRGTSWGTLMADSFIFLGNKTIIIHLMATGNHQIGNGYHQKLLLLCCHFLRLIRHLV